MAHTFQKEDLVLLEFRQYLGLQHKPKYFAKASKAT